MNSSPALVNLGGFFGTEGEEDDGKSTDQDFEEVYETKEIVIGGKPFRLCQYSWHKANANQVWPGAFRLADFINGYGHSLPNGKILELGAATGALALFLKSPPHNFDVVTTDIDDGGEVKANIDHNFAMNGIQAPHHVAFTWGNDWPKAAEESIKPEEPLSVGRDELFQSSFKMIVASDILLYVSAYPDLVKSLTEFFDAGSVELFLMSWNRRIAESKIFFELMSSAGFSCEDKGEGIYLFTRISSHRKEAPHLSPLIPRFFSCEEAESLSSSFKSLVGLGASASSAGQPATPLRVTKIPDVVKRERNQFAVVIDGVLTPEECAAWIAETETIGYETALVNYGNGMQRKVDDFRNSDRCIVDSIDRAKELWSRVSSFVPEELYYGPGGPGGPGRSFKVRELNERFRFLRYDPGGFFKEHMDGSYPRPEGHEFFGDISRVTLQVYLNEGFEGGTTRFFGQKSHYDVVPRTGSVLLFEHAMLHSGEAVVSGRKYALRSDVMYQPV